MRTKRNERHKMECGKMECTLYLTDFALCPLNKKLSVVFNSKKKQVCATHRETARDSVEGELSGGEQAERRRSGETE